MAISNVKLVKPSSVKTTTYWFKKASTAFNYRSLVVADEDETATAGTYDVATASTERTLGAVQTETTSTSSDYTSATVRKPILSDPLGEWEMPVGTGTADANDAGGFIDLKDTDELDVTASTIDAFFVSRFISATKLRGYIVRWHFNEAPATN